MKYKNCKTKKEKVDFILKMKITDKHKEIITYEHISISTLNIIHSIYSGDKLEEKKGYKPKYIEHKEY
mgnify:CR=1 FL=1